MASDWFRPSTWWHHQMETFSALLAIWRGIHRSPVNSPHKGQWRGVSFDMRPNKRLSNQSRGWRFETPSHPFWRHCNEVSAVSDLIWAANRNRSHAGYIGEDEIQTFRTIDSIVFCIFRFCVVHTCLFWYRGGIRTLNAKAYFFCFVYPSKSRTLDNTLLKTFAS